MGCGLRGRKRATQCEPPEAARTGGPGKIQRGGAFSATAPGRGVGGLRAPHKPQRAATRPQAGGARHNIELCEVLGPCCSARALAKRTHNWMLCYTASPFTPCLHKPRPLRWMTGGPERPDGQPAQSTTSFHRWDRRHRTLNLRRASEGAGLALFSLQAP